MSTHILRCTLAIALVGCLSGIVHAQQLTTGARNKSVSVVPAPGKVVIDGQLDDWDLTGEILTYSFPETAEKYHARTALMYDKDALYLSVRVRDDSPLMNFIDGKIDKSQGWKNDAVQFRLRTSDTSAVDMVMWYFTGRKEATLSINPITVQGNELQYRFEESQAVLGAESGMAYLQTDDGYTLEARFPWKRFGLATAPAPGTKMATSMQFLWGNASGTGNWPTVSMNDLLTSASFAYQNCGAWGEAVFEPTGHLARTPEKLPSRPEMAKPLTFTYAVPKDGHVSIGIFNENGALVRTLLTGAQRKSGKVTEHWDGLDNSGHVLPAGKYTVKALVHEGISQEWVVSLHNSGNPPWMTADGTGAWGGDHGEPIDIAAGGDRVFPIWSAAEAGWDIIGCDLNGKKQWGSHAYLAYGQGPNAVATDGTRVFISQGKGVTVHDAATGKAILFAGDRRAIDIPGGGITDLAYQDNHLYILANGVVHDLDLAQGKLSREIPVGPQGKGLAAMPGKPELVTLFPDGVHRIRLANGAVEKVFDAKFVTPFDAAFSLDGKLIFVSDRGRSENVVKVFTYPEGKPAGTVGKPGGRPAIGKFDPAGVFQPAGLAVDSKGRLWVTEADHTPKRISVWQPDGKHGQLVAEYFGASAYSVGVSADPEHPEYVYIQQMRWIVDYDKHTAKLDCTFARPGYDGPQPPFTGGGGFMGQTVRVRHSNGRTFLFSHSSVWEMKDDHAVPVYAWDNAGDWYDLNGDGFIQENERTRKQGPAFGSYWGENLSKDLTFEHASGNAIYRRGIKSWQNGLPIWYGRDEVKPAFTIDVKGERGLDPACAVMWSPSQPRCYVLESNDPYLNRLEVSGIAAYTPDGKRLWRYPAGIGMDLTAPMTTVGDIRGAAKFIGILDSGKQHAGELIGVNGYYGDYNLINEDGLFVAELCYDNRRGVPLGANVVCTEGFSGFIVQHPRTKKVYLMGGDSDGRIWEIKGLETLQRFTSALTISPTDVTTVTRALAEYTAASAGGAKVVYLRRLTKPVVVDGKLDEWDMADAPEIRADAGRGGRAMIAYDEKNLYLAYRVADDSPFVNAGKDVELLFKTGDLVDLILCTDPAADPQRKAGKGDLRLLFAPWQGQPAAILNQKVAQGGPQAPYRFVSPTGFEDYERVIQLKDASVAVQTTGEGYTLEAAIPLASIGFTPQPGKSYPIDFGILYSDPGGAKTLLRAYWANHNTTITGDIPTESRIDPPALGMATVE